MKRLKNLFTCIILGIMLIPTAMPVILQLQQLFIQYQMEEALEHESLITVSIKTKDIQWIRQGRECMVNNQLFDVKEISIEHEITQLTGLYDMQEKAIQQQLANHTKNQQHSNHKAAIIKLLLQYAGLQTTDFEIKPAITPARSFGFYSMPFYPNPFTGMNTPPPRV